MRFVAKEAKKIDAIRWTGNNVIEVFDWGEALGLVITSLKPDSAAVARVDPNPIVSEIGRAREPRWILVALTLHGEVEVDPGSWLAWGGTDCYPLDDGELHRLYKVLDDDVVEAVIVEDDEAR